MQKSLYIGNEKDEKEIKKNNYTYISFIRKRILRNKFTKVQDIRN